MSRYIKLIPIKKSKNVVIVIVNVRKIVKLRKKIGNTNPTFGGLMYGNYLKTHNIQPHRGLNSPKNIQSYNVALAKGQ